MDRARQFSFEVFVVLACAFGALAQTVPAIKVTEPNCKLQSVVTTLDKIDFANLTLQPRCFIDPDLPLTLRSGKFEWKNEAGGGTATLNDAKILPGGTASETRVIITFTLFGCGGSCSQRGYVQVITLVDGHPTIIQELSFDSQAQDTGATFDPKRGSLRIVARSNDGSAHCCPEHVDEALFALENGKFVLKSWKQLPIK